MAESNSTVETAVIEALFTKYFDLLSLANPLVAIPFFEIEDCGDNVFKGSFVLKLSDPERSVDFEQNSIPINGTETHSGNS